MTAKGILKVTIKTMKWSFIVFCIYLGSFLIRPQPIPVRLVEAFARMNLPTNLVLHVDSVHVCFRSGVTVRGLRLFDRAQRNPLRIVAGADLIDVNPFRHQVLVVGARYPRLPDGYYEPGNLERNARVEAVFPELPSYDLTVLRSEILGVRSERITGTVKVSPTSIVFSDLRLVWPDQDREMELGGSCRVDLAEQVVAGSVKGLATQKQIRPMLVELDVPVSLPYMDAFTGVTEPVPAGCGWNVNLVNNDFDLEIPLKPKLGAYNGVPMDWAEGTIRLHTYTRGTNLNYRLTVGPLSAQDVKGRPLAGTVCVEGTNGYNTVRVEATSSQPIADLLKIGGFMGDYVGDEAFGDSVCRLEFRFPRSMTNNYEVLNGEGSFTIAGGRLMRLKGMAGLVELLAERVPGISWFTDTTEASGSFVIENGVVKSRACYIEGSVFSIRMDGAFDAVKDSLDYTVRVQFSKKDSVVGKILHPLTWPFTKLLLEFRLRGSPSEPKWEYVSVIDRVLEAGGIK